MDLDSPILLITVIFLTPLLPVTTDKYIAVIYYDYDENTILNSFLAISIPNKLTATSAVIIVHTYPIVLKQSTKSTNKGAMKFKVNLALLTAVGLNLAGRIFGMWLLASTIPSKEYKETVPVKVGSKLVFAMFYALGTLSHVPQSFYITANDYWMFKFRNPDNDIISGNSTEKTYLQATFSSRYIVISNISSVSCIILTFLCARKISIQQRIVGSLSVMLTLLIITLILVWTDTDSWQNEFFIISLVIGALLQGSGACFMISIYQLAVTFPPVVLGTLLSGQSICGILVAAIQILTLAIGTSSKINAFLYFTVGVVFILVVEILFLIMMGKADHFQKHLKSETMAEHRMPIDISKLRSVAKRLAPILLTMVITSGSAVMMHPGVTSLIESVERGSGRWADVFFVPVCTFFLYYTFDFIGRECSIRWNWIGGTYAMLTVAIFRLIFVPLMLYCNIQPRNHLPVFFDTDYAYIVFIIIFAFTTGYLVNLCINQIQSVCTIEEKSIALLVTILVMIAGVTICSSLSSVIIKLI